MMLKSLKQKIAKVGIGLFCAGCVFLSSAAYSQAASYTAYALKLNKTNNFTSMHAKTTLYSARSIQCLISIRTIFFIIFTKRA